MASENLRKEVNRQSPTWESQAVNARYEAPNKITQ